MTKQIDPKTLTKILSKHDHATYNRWDKGESFPCETQTIKTSKSLIEKVNKMSPAKLIVKKMGDYIHYEIVNKNTGERIIFA